MDQGIFTQRFSQLNAEQQLAVTTIDGPVMVVAGPGTGKTELLSMRVANILRSTDTQPENILCLTFTESGAYAMRKRLSEIIGADAYKVAIHTFHSFGSDVISQHREYFYNAAEFQPADDLTTYELLHDILSALPFNHPFASSMNGEFTWLSDIRKSIEEFKKAGLNPDELREILNENQASIDEAEQILQPVFSGRVSKSILAPLQDALAKIEFIVPADELYEIPAILPLLVTSLREAVDAATVTPSVTPPITAWKKRWLTTDSQKQPILKATVQFAKLRLIADMYEEYVAALQAASRFDFDDMILQVVHATEQHEELRYTLQEKYQYFMVDEFQDTNLAQLRILHTLTDNPVNEDKPNIFVVGDPDQAIYSFQGADLSNIRDFTATYPAAKEIILTKNYRSAQGILDDSRGIITQSEDRFAKTKKELDQPLQAQKSIVHTPELYQLPDTVSERTWVAEQIRANIDKGVKPADIAVLMVKHSELQSIVPYIAAEGVAVSYERHDDVLALEPIVLLTQLARLIAALAANRHDVANGLVPEIIAHSAWGFSASSIWSLSTLSYEQRRRWIDSMEAIEEFQLWREWLIGLVQLSATASLELLIDRLIGVPTDEIIQPEQTPYSYYFSESALETEPTRFVTHLEALRTIRDKLATFKPASRLTVADFVAFVDLHTSTRTQIQLTQTIGDADTSVKVMTAHKSKGLEFEHVYIVGATDAKWKASASGKRPLISYPENLALIRKPTSNDERLRLFYVAMTRAKQSLTISFSGRDDNGKETMPASFLTHQTPTIIEATPSVEQATAHARTAWYQPIIEPRTDLKTFLAPHLEKYRLSATHLTHFLDLTYGGPERFVIDSLLRFPSSGSDAIRYGNAMHATLKLLHDRFAVDGALPPIETTVGILDEQLDKERFEPDVIEQYRKKGHEEIKTYLDAQGSTFAATQKPELNLAYQEPQLGEVRLTGKIDLVDINTADREISVTDYKTSKSQTTWNHYNYHYKQQLMFYKLLLESSRDYHTHTVTAGAIDYLRPTTDGQVVSLGLDLHSNEETERFKLLVTAVWEHIVSLTIPDTSGYSPDLKGSIAFENDLIDGRI